MDSALNLALDQAQKAGAIRVHLIRLRIGALSGVVPEALQFAFEALAPGTLAGGGRFGRRKRTCPFLVRDLRA